MSEDSQIIVTVDKHRDTIIKIYDNIHHEKSTFSEVSLTNRQVVKIIKDLSDVLYQKMNR